MKKAGIWLWLVAVTSVGVGLFSYRYLLPSIPVEAPIVAANRLASTGALMAHAGVAATALILGAIQFFPEVRRRWPAWHRRAGTVYVICCLAGGIAGLALAFGTAAGPVASLGFGALAVFWLFATVQAWRYAKARDFVRHQRWMTRSYALAFGAVTLRIYLPLFALAHVSFIDGYRIDSWLAWVPNLIFVELVLLRPRAAAPAPTAPRAA
ncbi:MAG TPA: DUF2306 domain-containing protein [Caulobacteraceae bacterium]|jgi:uncharacterized membrane protein